MVYVFATYADVQEGWAVLAVARVLQVACCGGYFTRLEADFKHRLLVVRWIELRCICFRFGFFGCVHNRIRLDARIPVKQSSTFAQAPQEPLVVSQVEFAALLGRTNRERQGRGPGRKGEKELDQQESHKYFCS